MFDFFAAMMAFRLIDEMFAEQRRLLNVREFERRRAIKATRCAIGIKKQQLWQQIEALKQTGHSLANQYQRTCEQIGHLKLQSRSQFVANQLQGLRNTLEQVRQQQAALKDVRQRIHEQVATLKTQGLQLAW